MANFAHGSSSGYLRSELSIVIKLEYGPYLVQEIS